MNKHLRTLCALAVTLLAALILSPGPGARAADSDTSAIATFLKIGLASAAANFSSIRGPSLETDTNTAQSPDDTHFTGCSIIRFPAHASYPDEYMYYCYSTLRRTSVGSLFKIAGAAVRTNLPSSFKSEGPTGGTDDSLWQSQTWSRSGHPKLSVEVVALMSQGLAFYSLSMNKEP